MQSIQRINARGQNQHGDAAVDYLTETEELSPELKAARDRAVANKQGAVGYYYDESEGDTQRWAGKLAEALGLAGKKVDKDHLLALARGFHPHTGEPLCKNAGEEPKIVPKLDRNGNPKLDKDGNPLTKTEGGHRIGFDLTTTPPKSVSIAFALAEGDEKYAILEAHRKAVASALEYLEDKVETRRGKAGRDVIGTRGLIVMQADHVGNRNLEMNLHTHSLILGVSQGEDGDWGTFDAQEIYRHRMASDQVYKNELAMNLRELGYGIEQLRMLDDDGKETGMVSFEVAGIDRELIETFSSRRQEILDYEAAHGVDRQAACLATRKHKDEPSPEEMDRMWKDTMAAINAEQPGRIPTIEQLKQEGDRAMRRDEDKVILERLHEAESYFTDHDLVDRLGQEYMGQLRLPQLLEKVEEFKRSNKLSRIEPAKIAEEDRGASMGRIHTEERFAAPWMVEWEKEVVHRVASRAQEDEQKVDKQAVDAGIAAYEKRKGFTLSGEQRGAVEYITAGSGGVAILEGAAGTGKTTVSDAYSEIFRAEGRRMLGACVSNKAAQKLEEESGMPCLSVAKMLSLLDRERMTFTDRDVLVIDEAGMIPTNETRQLLAHAQQSGCKVVIQGDLMQIQPIGAGSGMSLAKMAVEEHAQLTENYRQSYVEDKAITGLFYEKDDQGRIIVPEKGSRSRRKTLEMGREIFNALDARGCIDDYDNQAQAMEGLVQDYMASKTASKDKIVLASSNAEISALNAQIRQALKDEGSLPTEEVSFKAKDKNKGKAFTLQLARGDRVCFTENDQRNLGVSNGDAGTVERIRMSEEGGFDLAVRLASNDPKRQGRLIEFNTRDFNYLTHNYATTIHRAQGQSIQEVYHLANLGMMDNHSELVAFSRLTKGFYRLYGDTETVERLEERFGLERLKGNAITEGVREPATITEKVLDAQIQRQEHDVKTREQSALSELDLAWVREHGQKLAQAYRLSPALEQRRQRDRGISR